MNGNDMGALEKLLEQSIKECQPPHAAQWSAMGCGFTDDALCRA